MADEPAPPTPFEVLYTDVLSSSTGGLSSFFLNYATRYPRLSHVAHMSALMGAVTNATGDNNSLAAISAQLRGTKYAIATTDALPLTASSPATANTGAGASATLVSANTNRKGLVLINNSGADVWLGIGVAAENAKGICLKAGGGTWVMDAYTFSTAAINGYGAAATAVLIQEFT